MRFILFIFVLPFFQLSWAQEKVNWTVAFHSEDEKITFTAKVEEGWHVYSQNTDESVGPVATQFEISEGNVLKLKGKVSEPEPIKAYDENFGGEVMYFENEVSFVQSVKVKSEGVVQGTITYMVCNKEMCLPPVDVKFELEIKE